MGHPSLDLTTNIHTDPTLLDAAGAMESCPSCLFADS
jgi:hypothetical protein